MKPFTMISAVVFTVVAIVHLIRFSLGWEAVVNGFVIPIWWSAVAFVLAGGLAVMMWRELRAQR